MEFFRTYIKYRLPVLGVLVVFVLVFAIIFGLYGVPVKAAVYPGVICAVFLIIAGAVDYYFARRKHKALSELADKPDECGEIGFSGIYDSDYIRVIASLSSKLSHLRTESMSREADMTDYYTKWVHQIKLPIAAMKLTLEGEDSRLSRELSDELFRIEQYVGMVLTYLRLGSESSDYVFREYELDEIIKGEVKKFAGQFIRRGIRLDFRPSGKKVVTDGKWLGFVIEQLLSNALKYTRSGTITVYVENPLTLVIRDSGIGIAPEDIPRVFERGYTGGNGRGSAGSSGIGLWLCKRICDELGNSIRIGSEPGVGTEVRVGLEKKTGRFE